MDISIVTSKETAQIFDSQNLSLLGTFAFHLPDKKSEKNRVISCLCKEKLISTFGPFIFQHSFSKEQPLLRNVLPFSNISALCSCQDDNFLFGGTEDGNLSIWDLSTGELQRTITKAHYDAITSLSYTGEWLISGSKDAVVHVWTCSDLVDEEAVSCKPTFSCTEHSMGIVDICIFPSGYRFITLSRDRTAKIWDILAQKCIQTFVLPDVPYCVTINPQESLLFIGLKSGKIIKIDVYPSVVVASDVVHVADAPGIVNLLTPSNSFSSTAQDISTPIVCLNFSSDANFLLSLDESGDITRWEVATCQPIKKISSLKGALKFNKMITTLAPTFLFQSSAGYNEESTIVEIQRQVSAKGSRVPALIYLPKSLEINHTLNNDQNTTNVKNSTENIEMELKNEILKLKRKMETMSGAMSNLRQLNKDMYQKLLSETTENVGK